MVMVTSSYDQDKRICTKIAAKIDGGKADEDIQM